MELTFIIIWAVMVIILAFTEIEPIEVNFLKFILIFILIVFIVILAMFEGYNKGQKDALRGKFDYKMEVKYELRDSIYTPVDTTFVEINK